MVVQPFRNLEDLYNLQKALKKDGKFREMLLTELLFESNMRVSDALKLKWKDVMDDNLQVRDHIRIKEQKTRKAKTIPLTESLSKAFLNTYSVLKEPSLQQVIFLSSSPKVIRFKQAWSREYVTSFLKVYAKKVGIKDNIGAHSLRKTWAYQSYKSGTGIDLIRRIMNHSSVLVTEKYAGILQDRMDAEYHSVSKLHQKGSSLFDDIGK